MTQTGTRPMASFSAILLFGLVAAFVATFHATADDAEPGEPCTGVCSIFVSGIGLVSHDCGGGCCCDTLAPNPLGGFPIWIVTCCGFGPEKTTCGALQLQDGNWIPICQTQANGGAPCNGCDGTGIIN